MPKTRGTERFTIGKVPPSSLLRAVYPYLGQTSPRVLIAPGIGRDVAAVSYGKRVLVFSTDPITGTVTRIGRHSIHINANDIATAGARPRWYLCTVLLPPNTEEESLRRIMEDMDEAAKELQISVVGGHTEVTSRLERPIIAGFMVGETSRDRLVSVEDGQEGDRVLLTKTAGLEGTAIIALDHAAKLAGIGSEVLDRAREFSEQISVVREALTAARTRAVHAMHDPTEGGVLNGLWELSEASGLGIRVDAEKIPVASETNVVCGTLGLDPLKLMSSGSLLVAVDPLMSRSVQRSIQKTGVFVSEIGRLVALSKGREMTRGARMLPIKPVPTDELYKLA